MAIAVAPSHYEAADVNINNLSRLLGRLEHNLLSRDGDRPKQKSSYERNKIGANLEHARTLLLKLEQESTSTKTQPSKAASQPDLKAMRAQLKRLQNRLYELNQLDEGDSLSSDSDGEDVLARYAPAIKDTSAGVDIISRSPDKSSSNQQMAAVAAANLSSTLRARMTQPSLTDTGASSSNAFQTQTPQTSKTVLMGSRTPQPAPSTTEALMSHHSAEQEDLTSSLLTLATALKNSTLSFSDTLAASNPLVDRATGSLDKSVSGMEAAERKMGTLRRMTEGKGLWGRWLLYAYIGGLWILALVVVFVLPKLRF